MKKVIFSAAAFGLVAVSSMALAPTSAEAIPAFARQTGAACLSCHFQEVPALKAFGRAFKMNAFTDVGDQALVEDDNLSIPAVLNASMVVRANVNHVSGGGANQASVTAYTIPVDTNFLVAGRIGAHTGAFVEFGGGTGDAGTAANNIQLMNSWDMGGFKIGLGWANTSFGGDAVLNVSNVYGQHSGGVGKLGDVSAVQNSGFTNSMTEIGAWVGNDMGYVQFGLIAPGGGAGWSAAAGNTATSATQDTVNVGFKLAKLVRVVGTFDLGGWDTLVGFGIVTGKVGKSGSNTNGPDGKINGVTTASEMNLQFIDAQVQGEVGDMTIGVYGDWAHAKGKSNGNLLGAQDGGVAPVAGSTAKALGINQVLNQNQKFDAYSIRATVEPITGITVGLGYGYRKTNDSVTPTNSVKHQVTKLAGAYQLYQNSILSLSFTSDKTTQGATSNTVKTTTLDWETLM